MDIPLDNVSSPLKSICFYSPYSGGGNISGTRVRLEMLARELSAIGIEVHIVGPFKSVVGATTHYFTLDAPIIMRPFLGIRASRIIAKLQPDVVVLEGPALVLGLNASRLVQMIHDSKFATEHRRKGGLLLWLYYFLMCRICDLTVTVSEAERGRIANSLRIDRKLIQVSYNGVEKQWLEARNDGRPEKFDILYVSNFAKHKGHLRLLNSLRGKALRIAFVGGDLGTLETVRTYAEAEQLNVSFFSGLSTRDLISLYDSAKVFVFPSELEGFGIPFIEARARGLPVVASDIEVFQELADRIGGFIVNFNATQEVAAAVEEAMEQPRIQPDLKEFGWKFIAAQFAEQVFR